MGRYIATIQMDDKICNKCNEYINTSQIFFLIVGIGKIYIVKAVIYREDKIDYLPVVKLDSARVVVRCTPNGKKIFLFFGNTKIRGLFGSEGRFGIPGPSAAWTRGLSVPDNKCHHYPRATTWGLPLRYPG